MKLPAFLAIVLLFCQCSHRSATQNKTAETDAEAECLMMEEICGQAENFQKQFDALPDEEKSDMISVLNTYVEHCEKAREQCGKNSHIRKR